MALKNEQKSQVQVLYAEGFNYAEIGRELDIKAQQVRDYCRSKTFKALNIVPKVRIRLPKEKKAKTCDRCGSANIINTRKYCEDCKEQIKQERIKERELNKVKHLTCHNCNQTFITTHKQKYCSKECARKYKYKLSLQRYITVTCKGCGDEYQTRKGSPKRYCSDSCMKKHTMKSHEQFVAEILQRHKGLIVPLELYDGGSKLMKYKCLKCGNENVKRAEKLRTSGCPICHGVFSLGEQTVEEYLIEKEYSYEMQYKFETLKMNGVLRYDFAVFKDGKLSFLIEYDGRQHFEVIDSWGGIEELKRTQASDKMKSGFAKENNIPLIRIKYTCRDIKKEIEKEIERLGI